MSRPSSGNDGKEYVQLFVYKVPKRNRDALQKLLEEIAEKLRVHGTLHSEFFQLHSMEAFQGFMTIASTFAISEDEELWVELDHYSDREHRDQVMADLGRDTSAGALFRQLGPLVSKGYSIVMGEFAGMAPMTYNEKLTRRVREALVGAPKVVEKKMFGGVAFMVRGKMTVTVGDSRIMCRIDPMMQKELLLKKGCRPVIMRGREYKGYVRVEEKALRTREDLDYWVHQALDFNERIGRPEES